MKYSALLTTCLIQMALAADQIENDDSYGIFTDDDHAPAEFAAGYIK